jgi:hypothetical protein
MGAPESIFGLHMRRKRRKQTEQDIGNDIAAFPYAGINQVRFNGYDLRPCATPAERQLHQRYIEKEAPDVNPAPMSRGYLTDCTLFKFFLKLLLIFAASLNTMHIHITSGNRNLPVRFFPSVKAGTP